jgi:hypothetical protein
MVSIMWIIQGSLFGKESVKRSLEINKLPKVYKWKITEVTPGLIVFAAIFVSQYYIVQVC